LPPRRRFVTGQLLVSVGCSVLLLWERSPGHGAYQDVVAAISAELQRKPDDAALRYRLAEAHAGHEEWRACFEEIRIVERLAPGVHPVGYLRGLALHAAGKEDEAKRELDAFLTNRPGHVGAHSARGRVLMNLGDPAAAAEDFRKAMRHDVSPHAGLVAEAARALAAAGKADDASRLLDERLKAIGDDPELLACALDVDQRRGAWDAALRRVDALQKIAPRPEPWMATRARVLAAAGRNPDSLATWAALRDRLLSLPNLERGTPGNLRLLDEARLALGESTPRPVAAPPGS
jgi:predicted Zn-dependent protease